MEKLKLIKPTKEYEKEALLYIQEFQDYNSNINGVGGLYRYLDNYDGWLKHLDKKRNIIPSEKEVPSETFIVVRDEDKKIIGMVSIRLNLNNDLLFHAGNIGYSVRPTERRKGYASYALYLALEYCKSKDLDKVLVTCYKENIASSKTIKSCYGILENEIKDTLGKILQRYWIDVNYALDKLKEKYA